MNALLLTTALALGQAPDTPTPASTALDGVWTVIAMEVDGRPATITDKAASLAIKNSTLTLPGAAAMHGTLRLDLGTRGTMRVYPAAVGTGNRRDPTANNTSPTPAAGGPTNAPTGTSGTGIPGAASGVYVRTADYLIMTIGDPSAATATGTGTGPVGGAPASTPPESTPNPPSTGTVATVGQPPVTIVLRRATGTDAPPSTASTPPAATPAPAPPVVTAAPRRMSEFIGQNVTASDGTTVGRIDDMVTTSDGASYALSTTSGVTTPIPLNALNFGANGQLASLGLTADQFRGLPTLTNRNLNSLIDPNMVNRLRTGFGLPITNTTTSTTTIGNGTITSPNTGLPINPTGTGTGTNATSGTNANQNNTGNTNTGTNNNGTNTGTNQPGTTQPNTTNNQPGSNPNRTGPNQPNQPNTTPPSKNQPNQTPPKGSVPPKGNVPPKGATPPAGGGGTPGVPKAVPGKG